MTTSAVSATKPSMGAEMFARYAYAPNQLGYCGPPDSAALLDGSQDDIAKAAKQFTGAWPYLKVLARMSGIADPLDHRLVESYWLGGGAGAGLDSNAFVDELLAVIGPQAGHYWNHLTADLADEAAPNHCFHVFGVYPWSRLLGKGMDEHPLGVLDNCRITWGTVVSAHDDHAVVSSQQLTWDGATLTLSGALPRRIELDDATCVTRGDLVAVHWGKVCDRLTAEQVEALADSTHQQLRATNRRLAGQAS